MRRILNKGSVEFVLTESEWEIVSIALKQLKTVLPLGGDCPE